MEEGLKPQWQLQEAENRLSQVVEQACTSGPQTAGLTTLLILSHA
jgi:hypothetical protein